MKININFHFYSIFFWSIFIRSQFFFWMISLFFKQLEIFDRFEYFKNDNFLEFVESIKKFREIMRKINKSNFFRYKIVILDVKMTIMMNLTLFYFVIMISMNFLFQRISKSSHHVHFHHQKLMKFLFHHMFQK